VRTLGCINEKLVYGSTSSKLAAESAGMWQRYIIHRSENMSISGSEIAMPQSVSMKLSIHTSYTLAVDNDYMIICTILLIIQQQLGHVYGELQWSVNDIWSCKWVNWEVICLLLFITNVLVALIGKRTSDRVEAPCWEWKSTECQWFLVL